MMRREVSGSVLLVDGPEAHLHPSAVAGCGSVVSPRSDCRFQVVATSHRKFLRTTGSDVRFVKMTRGAGTWTDVMGEVHDAVLTAPARCQLKRPRVAELAAEVRHAPCWALSLHRGRLFVEGTLDEAVLDSTPDNRRRRGSDRPIHGTKNLEGLIDSELTVRAWASKMGILTDNTVTATMRERPKERRGKNAKSSSWSRDISGPGFA